MYINGERLTKLDALMFVLGHDFANMWTQLKNECMSHSSCCVVIFVSCLDVDAMCGAKIVSRLFQNDLIPHQTIPVVGYDSLENAFKQLDNDITTILCIGCGSIVDLEELFDIVDDDERRVNIHVIDGHRPWNLNNLFGSNRVICYDDGKAPELDKYWQAYQYLATVDDAAGDDELQEHDWFNESQNSDLVRNNADEDTETDGSHSTENDDSEREVLRKRRGRDTHLREEYSNLLDEYYACGEYLDSTATIIMYTVASMIGATSQQILWLAIMGITSVEPQYPYIYETIYPVMKDEITRLKNAKLSKAVTTSGREIFFQVEKDVSLYLFRQWSIYESMLHTSRFSAQMNLISETGRKQLQRMLAKMGVSLPEAKEQWNHLNPTLKKSLESKLLSMCSMYDLDGIIRERVVRKFGLKGSLSAGDCVEAVAALLELGAASDSQPGEETLQDDSKFWVSRFWYAWDALEQYDKLLEGMSHGKTVQRAIVSTATVLFEKQNIREIGSQYLLAVVKEGPDIKIFTNPLALSRLGMWVADGCAQDPNHAMKPVVVAVSNTATNKYCVLGMLPRSFLEDHPSTPVYNIFGRAFHTTAEAVNANVRMDAFNSSFIEVASEDLSRFLMALSTALSTHSLSMRAHTAKGRIKRKNGIKKKPRSLQV